jgi:hypothetical protein
VSSVASSLTHDFHANQDSAALDEMSHPSNADQLEPLEMENILDGDTHHDDDDNSDISNYDDEHNPDPSIAIVAAAAMEQLQEEGHVGKQQPVVEEEVYNGSIMVGATAHDVDDEGEGFVASANEELDTY